MRTSVLFVAVAAASLWALPAHAACDTGNPTNPENDCDFDGCTVGQGDCNDTKATMHPACGSTAALPEVCDALDNNCNGSTDEGDPGSGAACSTGLAGVCAAGVNHCVLGAIACQQTVAASPEICDGKDNDCVNGVDDGDPGGGGTCNTTLYGVCAAGTNHCSLGAVACQQNVAASSEICDGKDNNCDNHTDEGFNVGVSCTSPNPGVCTPGAYVCQPNGTSLCVSIIPPYSQTELCDNKDNDCDGQTDEGNPEGGGSCTTNYSGVCRAGTWQCLAGGVRTCVATIQPGTQTEICDGQDNNCNGFVDEGFNVGGTCTVGGQLGLCAIGAYQCGGGAAVCVGPGIATEVCDGKDNNCNGSTDESDPNEGAACSTNLKGVCAAGTRHCSSGSLACQQTTASSPEVCDSLDNDCDGNVNNGLYIDADHDNVRACGTCQAPGAGSCDCNDAVAAIRPGATEVCDLVDNNCNGQVDENVSRLCYTGPTGTYTGTCGASPVNCTPRGACRGVIQSCLAGNFPACTAAVLPLQGPTTELCDAIDNNCDGQTDEGLSGANCQTGLNGVCNPGTEQCTGAGGIVCNPNIAPGALTETCNNTDDDCDGQVDEQVTQRCFGGPTGTYAGTCPGPTCTPRGECRAGNQACNGAGAWLACVGATLPVAEVCDTKDNDCDGSADDGLIFDVDNDNVRACGTCGALASGSCDCDDTKATVRPGLAEACNGIDDNCEGHLDEGSGPGGKLSQNCYSGPVGTQGVGVCVAGVQACTAVAGSGSASWGACAGEIVPAAETCDTKDNDCDSQTDETFDQDHDGFVACALCGQPANCDCDDANAAIKPGAVELCDGVDQNCDGHLDDVAPRVCFSDPAGTIPPVVSYSGTCPGPQCQPKGECKAGTQTCTPQGAWGTCAGVVLPVGDPTQPETSCDGKDDNCNGTVDDGTFDTDGDGYTTCAGDCDDTSAEIHPGTLEICDNKDNDCDGHVDGNTTSCYSGPAGTLSVGLCKPGTATCASGQPTGACTGEVLPTAELCDGLDNDCDGTADEDYDQDGDGATDCSLCGNKPGCDCDDADRFRSPAQKEICDCQDNNCNAQVDEGQVCLAAPCHDFDADGISNCQGDCDDHNAAIGPNRTEVIGNGADDDCNGNVDEDVDMDGDGYSTGQHDCDDHSKAVNPGAVEVCDGFDNNCDGKIDEGFDQDQDFASTCVGDCNDNDATVSPFRDEVCGNAKDDNCDGRVDEDTDLDGDGVKTCEGDCNDYQASVHPAAGSVTAAEEICDGQDNDCNGIADDGFDLDHDYSVTCLGDCDDTNKDINPGHWEVPGNGKDDNCNGAIDEGAEDRDHDGFSAQCGDCNDNDQSISPHGTEVCDRVDNNCDGFVDSAPGKYDLCAVCFDSDKDGQTNCDGDCDDADSTIYRGASELCDLKDNDCDGQVDLDPGTGYSMCRADAGSGTTGDDGGASANDDGGSSSSDDAGVSGDERKVVATSCGCASADGLGLFALAGAWALWAGRRRRAALRGTALTLLLVGAGLGSLTGCGSRLSVPDPEAQGDGGTDGADGGDAGAFVPPVDNWACPEVSPTEMLLTQVPSTSSVYAHGRDFETTTVQIDDAGVGIVLLDNGPRNLAGFVLRRPLPSDLDPEDPTALETVASREIQGLAGLGGSPLVQDRVERFSSVFVSEKDTRNASAAETLTFSTATNAFAVRNRLVTHLSDASPAALGALPVVTSAAADTQVIVYLFFRVTTDGLFIGAAVTTPGDLERNRPTLNDLTNGSHLSLPHSALSYQCEHRAAPSLKTDFIFVVDNSGSMVEEQAALSAAATGLFEAFRQSGLDFRVGVITTDSDILRGQGFTSDVDQFKADVRVGVDGNATEMGLEYALRAIRRARLQTEPTYALRDGAGLVIVFVSDEENLGLLSLADYQRAYRDEDAVAFAIVGPRPTGCVRVGLGIAQAGTEYIDLATATGGGSGSICNPNLAEVIEEVVFGAIGASARSPLGKRPVSGSLGVRTDHSVARARSHGFDYDPSSNSVLFFGEVPPAGTSFDVAYAYFDYLN